MNQLESVANLLQKVANNSSKIGKETLLSANKDMPYLKEILHFIFNPYIKTNIGKKKLDNYVPGEWYDTEISVNKFFEYFKEGSTGNSQDVSFAYDFIYSYNSDTEIWLATAMVTQDLKIGANITTLNKVFGKSFIPKIGVMLGTAYDKVKDKLKGTFIVTEKIDGHRLILIKKNGKVSFYSRNGLPMYNLPFIEKDAEYLPDNYMYDGECTAMGDYESALVLRKETNAIMATNGTKIGIMYNVFDMMPLNEFEEGKSVAYTYARKVRLGAMFGDESIKHLTSAYKDIIMPSCIKELKNSTYIKAVPILSVTDNMLEVMEIARKIWASGFEGVMLNTTDSKYEVKRSKNLIKIKEVQSYDLPIVDFEEGTGRNIGRLGAFVVDYKGYRLNVGSGLNDLEREQYWNNREELLGCKIEIDTFGETSNRQGGLSLNAPIFKGLRRDK